MKDCTRIYERAVFTMLVLLLALPVFAQRAQQAGRTAAIWQDRGDIAALDVAGGPSGTDHDPGTEFRFIKESQNGTSPKFDVEDEHGIRWKVKLGEEAKSETAATRLLWAAGYLVDEDYYRAQIRVLGLTRLARGQQFVSNGGTVTGARLERDRGDQELNTWSWYDNPFIGTREFNGLRVMMALVSNWDLKAVNNGVSDVSGGGGQYSIADLGATFGRTGDSLNRSKGVPKDYAESLFIEKVTPTHVDFVMHSRPFFLTIFSVPYYRFRTRMESVAKHVPIADARWIGNRLGQLSTEQIGDCFRAGGFSPAEVEAYTRAVTQRIAALKKLDPDVTVAASTGTDPKRCLESTCRSVPLRETLSATKLGTPYAQAIFGGFEQGVGPGGGIQLSSADAIPGLQFRATALMSSQRARRFDLEALIPTVGGSRNHAEVWFTYLQRETNFFGIGPRTPLDAKTQFTIAQRSYQGSFYRDLADHLQGGVYLQVMNSRISFRSDGHILSYGGFFTYDALDNSTGLTRGVSVYGRVASADGLGHHDGLTDYGWIEEEVDVRGYAPLGSPRTSLLVRARGQFKTPKGGGSQIPFYDLSWLGGRKYLRGYDTYRFRGNNVLLLSTELQQTVHSITGVRGVDLFASADAGQVWMGSKGVGLRTWHSGLGGGLQYRHSRHLAARVEVSRGDEGARMYWSLSRGF